MGHVLVELEKSNSTTELAKSCLEMIFSKCDIEYRFRFLNEINAEDLNWCDSYLAVRPYSPVSLSIAKAVKATGRFYTIMFDDDLLNRESALIWRSQCARKCVQYADAVLSPNPILAEEYAQITDSKRYIVLNTPVDESEIVSTHSYNEKTKFVYAAGRDHTEFFVKHIKPVLNEFLSDYAEKVHFTFIGVEPDLSGIDFKECFSFVQLMPLDSYCTYMRENQYDVGLAPLDDTRFTNRKYFNKFIEYSKVGVTGLYSRCLPFTLIIRDKENGILVNNNPQSWLEALRLVVDNHTLIEKCASESQRDLRQNFSVESLVRAVKKQIPEFEAYQSGSKKQVLWHRENLKFNYFKVLDKLHKFNYQLTHKGVQSTIKLIQYYLNKK